VKEEEEEERRRRGKKGNTLLPKLRIDQQNFMYITSFDQLRGRMLEGRDGLT